MIIKTSYANIYKYPTFESELINQGLMWDSIELIEFKNNWFRVKQWDGYIGWVHRFYVSEEDKNKFDVYYSIPVKSLEVYEKQNNKEIINQLLFGSYIPIKSVEKDYLEIYLPKNKIGYIENKSDYSDENEIRKKIIEKSKMFVGVPYLWGGSSAYGFDCSGFVQSMFKFFGINFDRDTYLQIENKLINEIDSCDVKKADLIYFYLNDVINHVGFLIEGDRMIHSSGRVVIESVKDVVNRLKSNKDSKVITKIFSVDRLIESRINYGR